MIEAQSVSMKPQEIVARNADTVYTAVKHDYIFLAALMKGGVRGGSYRGLRIGSTDPQTVTQEQRRYVESLIPNADARYKAKILTHRLLNAGTALTGAVVGGVVGAAIDMEGTYQYKKLAIEQKEINDTPPPKRQLDNNVAEGAVIGAVVLAAVAYSRLKDVWNQTAESIAKSRANKKSPLPSKPVFVPGL